MEKFLRNLDAGRGAFFRIFFGSRVCVFPPRRHFSYISVYTSLSLLERDEPRGVCGSDTRATVLDGLVGDGELAKIVSNHLGLKERIRKKCSEI